jgi:hypothetical protein
MSARLDGPCPGRAAGRRPPLIQLKTVVTYHAAVARDWMRRQLEAFDNLAMRYENSVRPGDYIGDRALLGLEQLHRWEPTIKQILRRLDPQLAQEVDVDKMAGESHASAVAFISCAMCSR